MNRPTLIPGLPRAWRGPSELQLGSDPARAVLLQLTDPRAAGVLDLLDGTRPERAVLLRAAELGVAPEDARALLDTLHAAGLVLPAAALLPPSLPLQARQRLTGEAAALALRGPAAQTRRGEDDSGPAAVLRRREAARVTITGHGRLGAPIAVALAEAGVGQVHADLPGAVGPAELPGGPLCGADVGLPRREAIAAAVLRAAPGTRTHAVRQGPASLVVQLDHDQPVGLVAAAHAARRQTHLAVTIREGAAVIGPLVPPDGAPCLHCLDLHRRDRDAAWPGPAARSRHDTVEPCAVATLLAATAYATAEILGHLDGGSPRATGAAAEITAPSSIRLRTWPAHPACPCARSQRSP